MSKLLYEKNKLSLFLQYESEHVMIDRNDMPLCPPFRKITHFKYFIE